MPGNYVGELDVVISEAGDVESAELREPVHPLYNALLLEATRRWKYQPAIQGGVGVKFLKTISVNLRQN